MDGHGMAEDDGLRLHPAHGHGPAGPDGAASPRRSSTGRSRPDRPSTAADVTDPGSGTSKADDGDLYLLDGNSLVFRAFFALPIDLATKAGQVTNAVHGFTSMLVMLLRDNEPGGMAVAFDRPEPTFRDEIVEEYKGNRPDTPDLLIPQFALVRAGARGPGHRHGREGRLRGRRHPGHPGHPGTRRRPQRRGGERGPRHVPTGRGPATSR